MACPCECLVEGEDAETARHVAERVAACVWGIEDRFSRYLTGNIVHAINTSNGRAIVVDAETAQLLDFAATLHRLSGGRFDVTSGVLRRAWRFEPGAAVPERSAVEALLPLVGWHKVTWCRPEITMRPGMEIDFGGIGKEYAVDCAIAIARQCTDRSCLVNLGGDLGVTGPRRDGHSWRVGVEAHPGSSVAIAGVMKISQGALATSGSAHRCIVKDGRRYSHILDARTGWPIVDAPGSVTVAAATCIEAGTLTTLAMLEGLGAEAFLAREGVRHWVQR
jgi:thiamine biosynthesis lipoprotein